MKYEIFMTDTGTNETKAIDFEWIHQGDPDDVVFFDWTEGNDSCDCNRGMLFYDDDNDYPCGEKRFKLEKIVNVETKQVIFP